MLAAAGECEMRISSSPVTDLMYILSEGGKRSFMPSVLERLRGLRTFVNVFAVSDREVDGMLAAKWADPEDALLFEVALRLRADCLIARNRGDFESGLVRVMGCEEFFAWMKQECGLEYDEVNL